MNFPRITSDAKYHLLASMGLPVGDYVIAGSGPLFARGWIADTTDIDVVARRSAWSKAATLGTVEDAPFEQLNAPDFAVKRIVLAAGSIEVLNGWFPRIWSTDELIDGAEFYEGFPFVRLDVVIRYKMELRRARDLAHLSLISEKPHARPT